MEREVQGIRFSVLSPDEIRSYSAVEITETEGYDDDGNAVRNGIMDPRLGSTEPGEKCETCSNTPSSCPGHFGHIELSEPMVNIAFANQIFVLLKAFCPSCGRIKLLANELDEVEKRLEEAKLAGARAEARLVNRLVLKAKVMQNCPYCGAEQKTVELLKPTTFSELDSSGGSARILPSAILERLKKIVEYDMQFVGLNPEATRPEWMLFQALPVPPIAMRPSIVLEEGLKSEDDLTHKLIDILRVNHRLRVMKSENSPAILVQDLVDLLQYHVTTYLDNDIPWIPQSKHRSGRVLKGIAQRLKGKEGRFRLNLSGKRGDFSGRSVLSPDPNMEIGEIGVPEEMARRFTIDEAVRQWNREELKRLVLNGPFNHPGANAVVKPDGIRFRLDFAVDRQKIAEMLDEGWIVERHLRDGDTALHNRPPSLHRMSIMAHRVKVLPTRTLALHPSVCVTGETEVLCDGYTMTIKDLFESREREKIRVTGSSGKKFDIKSFWKVPKEKSGRLVIIHTKSGRRLEMTTEHPVLTEVGMKSGGRLRPGDRVVVMPGRPSTFLRKSGRIFTEKDVLRNVPKGIYVQSMMKKLRAIELSELKWDDPRSPVLARLLGCLFGDGSLVIGKDVRTNYVGSLEEVENVCSDLDYLKIPHGRPRTQVFESRIRTKNGKILHVKGSVSSTTTAVRYFAVLMKTLGAPVGDRPTLEYRVPEWIMRAPLYIKASFLAGYFGADMSVPKVSGASTKSFRPAVFKLNKLTRKIKSGVEFVEDMRSLLVAFGVRISNLAYEQGNLRRDGTTTETIVATMANTSSKEIFGTIGYGYNSGADAVGKLAYCYLGEKDAKIEKYRDIQKAVLERHKAGVGWIKISRELCLPLNLVRSMLVSNPKIAGICYVGHHMQPFAEWKKSMKFPSPLVLEEVASVRRGVAKPVYDITVKSNEHLFLANGIVSGNCPSYNSDFDGDAVSVFVPQSIEAIAEMKSLMAVETQLMTPRYGAPIVGGIKDFIVGAYLLTRDETRLDKEEFSNLAKIGGYEDDLPESDANGSYTGKRLFSLFLPRDFSYVLSSKWNSGRKPNDVVIKDGALVAGAIDTTSFGAEQPNSILHRIIKDYGNERGIRFLTSVERIIKEFITRRGFSFGYDGIVLTGEAQKAIEKELDEAYSDVTRLIKRYEAGELEEIKGLSRKEALEFQINNRLNRSRERAGSIAFNSLPESNEGILMARTGSRGSSVNIGQMAAALGQQTVRGKRIERGYGGRTLSHFKRGSLDPASKGFVRSSFRSGLSPTEFFFHAMGGREGIVDTAVRTQQSGYMERRLVNAMIDIKVENDYTARDSDGRIVQFVYGDDAVDVAKSDYGKAVSIERLVETLSLEYPSRNKPRPAIVERAFGSEDFGVGAHLLEEARKLVLEARITELGIREMLRRLGESASRSRIEPGEAVGVVAAQSVGEAGTQLVLRTFHFAGIAMGLTEGLPRMIELVDARKSPKTPAMTIYLDEKHRGSAEEAKKVAGRLVFTKLKDVVKGSETLFGEGILLKIDGERLRERELTMEELEKSLKEFGTVTLSEDSLTVSLGGNVTAERTEEARKEILNAGVKGTKNISNVSVVKDEGTGEWILQTAGSNLKKAIETPEVDWIRTRTNDVHEIASVLGIEAARAALIDELTRTLGSQGLHVDVRHLMLIADTMCVNGFLQPVGRTGVVGSKRSVLAKAAFEIAVPTLSAAARRGESDELKGVVENILIGQRVPVGTGTTELFQEQN